MTDCKHLELKLTLAMILALSGCAAQKPKAAVPANPNFPAVNICYDSAGNKYLFTGPTCPLAPVPGHPGLHYGPWHLYCNIENQCEWGRPWLNEKGDAVLSPLGCWLAKTRITWIFGDRVSQCEHRIPSDPHKP
jgi:hypothetical protein